MIKKFSLYEQSAKPIVFAFGRFNPPTIGHEKLIDKTKAVAGNVEYRIYPSFTQNQKKDPLPHTLKVAYMRKMFPRHRSSIIADKDATTAINIAVKLYDQGYTDLQMVAGSDRVKEFETLLRSYNGVEGKRHGFYKFNSIDVISAGERDPDAEGVEGMSASKMRAAAQDGDLQSFEQGLPAGFRDKRKLYRDVRKYMGIREEKDMGVMDEYEQLRDAYLTGKIWNIDDLIEANGVEGRIIQKGTNYVAFNDGDGKVHKAWLHEIKLDEKLRRVRQDKDVKDDPGTQPAKYYSGVKKSTKDRRAAHFRKGAKMDDDNPAAYKPAPGDAKGKTKPSKHTLKYKKMFGDETMPKTLSDILDEKIDGLVKKSEKSGIPYGILKQVYNRGMAAWRTGHRPGTTPQQWAFARVNSFVTKSKGTWGGADKDLAAKARGAKKSEAYEQGTDEYANYTKRMTPGQPIDEKDFKTDRKLKNLKTFTGKSSVGDTASRVKKRKAQRAGTPLAADFHEQSEHEITVGNYTTKFFYMCGSAQTTMKKHADKEGAEELTRMQDLFYKMEKDAMDAGGASDEQKKKSQILYDKIIAKADDMGIKGEVDKYMKMHLGSMLNNKPKLGFGRTDLDESLWANIHKKRERIKRGSGEKMRKVGDKGAPTPDQMRKAKLADWYQNEATHEKYEERYGDEWFVKLTETYNRMLEKLTVVEEVKYPQKPKQEETKEENMDTFSEFTKKNSWGQIEEAAEYQGKKVTLNDPIRSSDGKKKFYVYVKNEKGNVIKLGFGDPNMEIKRDDPARRKSFRARHNCDNPGPKYKARYWSCMQWRAGAKVDN